MVEHLAYTESKSARHHEPGCFTTNAQYYFARTMTVCLLSLLLFYVSHNPILVI